MRVVLIRHPETVASCLGQFPRKDEGYSEEGKRQFQELTRINPTGKIITSDLPRCLHLAEAIAKRYDVSLTIEPRIREIDMGVFQGYTFTQLEEMFPMEVATWMQDPDNFTYPDGERYLDFRQRVLEFAGELAEGAYTLITHHGVIQVLLSHWVGDDMSAMPFPCAQSQVLERIDGPWILTKE